MNRIICPKCKSKNNIPIVYGYPSSETMEASMAGRVKLGGCEILIDGCRMPDRFCADCEYEWSVDRFTAEDIVKVRYRYWSNWGCFDPESTEEAQWAYDIYPDGTVKYYAYPRARRKVLDRAVVQITPNRVNDFYNEVIRLYRPWTVIVENEVLDGCSYELTITYKDKRKRKLTGAVGGGTVDDTVWKFLGSIQELQEKSMGD